MSSPSGVDIVLAAFDAVERRDDVGLAELCDDNVEFCWPPSLPYGGTVRSAAATEQHSRWSAAWDPVQPTKTERRMDPRVVAATEQEVVVLWRQRGLSPIGGRFDGEVLGLYRVRHEKLTRAQMFYFDPVTASAFLASAHGRGAAQA